MSATSASVASLEPTRAMTITLKPVTLALTVLAAAAVGGGIGAVVVRSQTTCAVAPAAAVQPPAGAPVTEDARAANTRRLLEQRGRAAEGGRRF